MFKIAYWSCTSSNADCPAIYAGQRLGAKVFISQGDDPYMQLSVTQFDGSRSPLDKDSTVADFVNSYSLTHDAPAIQSLQSSGYHFYKMPDDHEWGGDNWDHSLTQANAQTGIGASTQAEVDEHFNRGIQAFQQVATSYTDNVANNDAEAVAEKPASADAGTPASNYPPIYFRVGYDVSGAVNNTSPHVELFFIDCISYRNALTDTDNSSKTMLGANQKAWLKKYLNESTATFKIIASGKRTYLNTLGNGDTWNVFTTERDEILQYIKDNSITGVVWIAGDQHYPHVIATEDGGGFFDHVCVTACPVGVETNATDLGNGIIWAQDHQVFGLVEVNESYVEISIRHKADARVYWRGRVNAGENKLAANELQAAM